MPSIFFGVAAFLATIFFALKKDSKQISVKVFVIYTLSALLAFGLLGLTGLSSKVQPLKVYIGLQTGITLLGAIHAIALYKLSAWQKDSFLHELIFTLYITVVSALAFVIVYSLCNNTGYSLIFSTAIILFIVPFLIGKTFEYLVAIPEEVYPKWFYPVNGDNDLPEELLEDTNVVIVEFRMLQTDKENSEVIKSRSKLPLKIEFSRFFPAFIDAFNDKNPGRRIEYIDTNKQPHGWNFYLLPKWYQFKTYINPQLTIRENGIKENSIIIAERV